MRSIKFRAWHNNKMCHFDLFTTEWEAMSIKDVIINAEPIMQYTGLKDKNGVKIYESDRVKTPAGIGVVRWDRCFRLFWNDKDSTTLHDCIEEQLEIVGNTYEA